MKVWRSDCACPLILVEGAKMTMQNWSSLYVPLMLQYIYILIRHRTILATALFTHASKVQHTLCVCCLDEYTCWSEHLWIVCMAGQSTKTCHHQANCSGWSGNPNVDHSGQSISWSTWLEIHTLFMSSSRKWEAAQMTRKSSSAPICLNILVNFICHYYSFVSVCLGVESRENNNTHSHKWLDARWPTTLTLLSSIPLPWQHIRMGGWQPLNWQFKQWQNKWKTARAKNLCLHCPRTKRLCLHYPNMFTSSISFNYLCSPGLGWFRTVYFLQLWPSHVMESSKSGRCITASALWPAGSQENTCRTSHIKGMLVGYRVCMMGSQHGQTLTEQILMVM